MSMDTEASLREYLKLHLRIPLAGRIGPLAKAFDFVATAAPGVREILTVGKLCWEVKERHFDLVVVDAPASGHVVSQLGAPQAINDLVKVGQIRSQTDWMLEILSDPDRTGVVAGDHPRGDAGLRDDSSSPSGSRMRPPPRWSAVVVNRVLPELFTTREEEVFERLRTPELCQSISEVVGGDVAPVLEAARLAVTMRRARAVHLRHLQERLDPRIPVLLRALPLHPGGRPAQHPTGRHRPRRRARPVTTRPAEVGSASLDRLLASKEIAVTCGPGGVGKTTIAAATAAMAACHHGGRVLVLTVDPARRLADALGLKGIGNAEHRIPDEMFVEAGVTPRGELWAAMLDTQASWNALIERHAPDQRTKEQILANPLYQNLAGRFVQSHDYIAVERLFEIHSTGNYDLIVVDTPPNRHALDFLDAPKRMAEFFSSRLLRWLIVPYRSRLVNLALSPLLAGRRSDPWDPVPFRHRGVLHPVPVDARRLRRAGRRGGAAPRRTAGRRSSS